MTDSVVYSVRMARVNVSIPDEVIHQARAAGLNVSAIATSALREALADQARIASLEEYLTQLDHDLGSVSEDQLARARTWAIALRDGT